MSIEGLDFNQLAYTPPELVERVYARSEDRLGRVREVLRRPMTLVEKVLYSHVRSFEGELARGAAYGGFDPDRLASPDSGAQMVLLQLMSAGDFRVDLPVTVHCDHLIRASEGSGPDLDEATSTNGEVYRFLESAAAKCGLGFWRPGSGIIHQVILENYAFPGGLMFATDSHTPNAGGLGMVAVGVGGADGVDAMVGLPVSLRMPRLIGVRLSGELSGWSSAKDVILEVASRLTVKGGTGAVLEYFGEGAESLSATGKATICNMGAEIGATTSVFGFDAAMSRYLSATGRQEIAALAQEFAAEGLVSDPEAFFDMVVDIDLSALEPRISGPGSPDLVRPVSHLADEAVASGYPLDLSYAMIGSCTNSSYEDIGRAADIARQARAAGLCARTPLFVTPGSESVRQTLERDGLLDDLVAIGARVLSNACGPCIGQWNRTDGMAGERNSIITSFNRNFPRRNDGHAETLAFIASPEIVVAAALTGRLDTDPRQVNLLGTASLSAPNADELPAAGWMHATDGFVPPPPESEKVRVEISPESDRLAALQPFEPPAAHDCQQLRVLVKVEGKCTTDHISPAGPWLRYRGHIDRLSDNTLTGAINAFTSQTGTAVDLTDNVTRAIHQIARRYQDAGIRWVVIGDHNYGEGSSREHAAMQIRYLGGLAVIARSFARIHETNLKKQGVLPLVFADPDDYHHIRPDDTITIPPPATIRPDTPVNITVNHADATTLTIPTTHTLNHDQLTWITAGSAINTIRDSGIGAAV